MYRILIKNREQNQTKNFKYSFYSKDDIVFQSNDLNIATKTFRDLMETYLLPDLTIVDLVETNVSIDSPDLKSVTMLSDYITLINNGTEFAILFNLNNVKDESDTNNNCNCNTTVKLKTNIPKMLGRSYCSCTSCGLVSTTWSSSSNSINTSSKDNGEFTAIDTNPEVVMKVKKYLESLGLVNVQVHPTVGITADNPTGEPVEGTLEVEKGLFQYYSRKTHTSDYVSSAFSVVLVSTKENDSLYIDVKIVDQDGEPLEVEDIAMFNRYGTTDHHDSNVSEIHIQSLSGIYTIFVRKEGYVFEERYNYEFMGYEADTDVLTIVGVKITDYDMSEVSFEDKTFVYDGEIHMIEISGELPEGVTVEYENNVGIESGVYEAIAHFTGDKYHTEIEDMKATLTIIDNLKEVDANDIEYNNVFSVPSGNTTPYSISVKGELPEGIESVEFGDNNFRSSHGTTFVKVTFKVKEGYKLINAPETIELIVIEQASPKPGLGEGSETPTGGGESN